MDAGLPGLQAQGPLNARGERRHTRWLWLAIGATALAAYANTLGSGFVYDDSLITDSPLVRAPWNLRELFSNGFYGASKQVVSVFRPLTEASHVLNAKLELALGEGTELQPASFHAVNVLLHALASVLAFVFLEGLRVRRGVCLASALLFAVHPIHSEAVANIWGRAELLAAVFALVFLIAHQRRRIAIAVVAGLLALWSKESAIAVFPLAIVIDALFVDAARPSSKRAYVCYALLLAAWFAQRSIALRSNSGALPFVENPLCVASALQRVCTAASVQLLYLRLQLLPVGLSSDYSYHQLPLVQSPLDPAVLGFALLLASAGAFAWSMRARAPAFTLAVCGYAFASATTSNFILPIGTIAGERLCYLPSLFACLAACLALARLQPLLGARALTLGLVLLLGAGSWLTIARNRTWHDELVLFRAQVASAPRSAKAHLNLATALSKHGDDDAARAQFQAALEVFPRYAQAWYGLGFVLQRLHADPARVIDAYRNARRNAPRYVPAQLNLAAYMLERGHDEEARAIAREIELVDADALARSGLLARLVTIPAGPAAHEGEFEHGLRLFEQGDFTAAVEYLERVVASATAAPARRQQAAAMLVRCFEELGKPKRANRYRELAGVAPGAAREE